MPWFQIPATPATPATPAILAILDNRMLPSRFRTLSAFATTADFGAQSSRPASSLQTLSACQSPGQTAMLATHLPATALV